MKKLKVWGGLTFTRRNPRPNGNLQARTIVAAPTKKRAVELLNQVGSRISMNYFNDYWAETGNKLELSLATEEGIWINQGEDNSPKFERSTIDIESHD